MINHCEELPTGGERGNSAGRDGSVDRRLRVDGRNDPDDLYFSKIKHLPFENGDVFHLKLRIFQRPSIQPRKKLRLI